MALKERDRMVVTSKGSLPGSSTPTRIAAEGKGGRLNLSDELLQRCSVVFANIRRKLDGQTPTVRFATSSTVQLPSEAELYAQKEALRLRLREAKVQSAINYLDPAAFVAYDNQYFYRNLYKYLMVSAYYLTSEDISYQQLVDLGCGVGAFSLAWTMMQRELQDPQRGVMLVDNGPMQLGIATALLQHFDIGPLIPKLGDLRHFASQGNALTLCGYLAASIGSATERSSFFRALGRKNIVVDYSEVVDQLAERSKTTATHLWGKVHSNFLSDVKTTTIMTHFVSVSR